MTLLKPAVDDFTLGKSILDFSKGKAALVSIVDPGYNPPNRPPEIPANLHKVIYFHDFNDEDLTELQGTPYLTQFPEKHHIEDLIYWFNEIRNQVDLVIVHCMMGVSRSPAVSYIFNYLNLGEGSEEKSLQYTQIGAIFGGVKPNERIVRLADETLNCNGKLFNVIYDYNKAERERIKNLKIWHERPNMFT